MLQTKNQEKTNKNIQDADYIGSRRLSVAPMPEQSDGHFGRIGSFEGGGYGRDC